MHLLLLHLLSEGVDAWAAGERPEAERTDPRDGREADAQPRVPAPDRELAHRPRLAVAVAGGLPGGPATFRSALDRMREYPSSSSPATPPRTTSGSRRSTRGCSPRSRPASTRAAGRSSAAGGSSRIATSRRRVVRAPRADLAGLLPGKIRADRDRRLQRRSVRAQRDAAPDPAQERHGLVRPHAPRTAREDPALPDLLVAVARRQPRVHVPLAARVLLARARTSGITSTSPSPSCPPAGSR